MKPQGKVTIFMVVMIVMLSIYYFALPNNKDKNKDNDKGGNQVVVRSEEFVTFRKELEDSRKTMIDQLNTILVSSTVNVDEKNQAIETINTLNTLTANEMMLETKIMSLGYNDAFVNAASTNSVTVSVLANNHTVQEANKIILMTKTQFGTSCDVTVQFVGIKTN